MNKGIFQDHSDKEYLNLVLEYIDATAPARIIIEDARERIKQRDKIQAGVSNE